MTKKQNEPQTQPVDADLADRRLTEPQVREIAAQALAPLRLAGKKVLLIVPDATRTAPVGLLFRVIHDLIGSETKALDVMIALGTHPPMSDDAINRRLEITAEERAGKYRRVRVLNHAWNDPAALAPLGVIPASEIGELSGGLFEMDVAVSINRAVLDYDQLIIVGPVFPHEVVGFSGGNKYLFPGVGGPGHPQLLPLARRRHHQPQDHRQQGDAGAPRRGPRRRDGSDAALRLLHGGA